MSDLFNVYTFGTYKVRKAVEADATVIYNLLQDTADWLRSKGVSQWEYFLHGEGSNEVKQAIKSGITYIVENSNGDVAAVFNFTSVQNDWDIDIWGVRNDSAYYLHKLAVARDHHQQKIGKQILGWINKNIQMKDGYVRLDCIADNIVLNDFYQRAGYTCVGQTNLDGDNFSLYEKAF